MTLTEKAAYIKGLADGLNYNKESAEGKLIAALIDMVDEMAQTISDLEADVVELNDYIEEIDEDLGSVEEYLYDDCDCDCDCDCFDDDEEYYEIKCPSCGEVVCFDESIDPEDLMCPACHEKIACLVEEEDLKKIDD